MKDFKCSSIFVFILLLTACHKDEIDQKGTITFTVNDTYYNYWVVISDQSGKVSEWKAMTNGVAQSFSFTQNKDSINITYIRKDPVSKNYLINTYIKVAPGDYSITDSSITPASPIGNYIIDVSSNYSNGFGVESENICGYPTYDYSSGGVVCSVPLCGPNANLFSFLYNSSVFDSPPRTLYKPSINPGETLVIDDDLFNQLPIMKSKTITFSEPSTGFSLALGNTINKEMSMVSSFYETPSYPVSSMPVYYPDLTGTLFSDYVFEVQYSSQKNIINSIALQSAEPADSYPPLNLTFNLADSTLITPTSITVNSTGAAHYVFSAFNYYTDPNLPSSISAWWYVYSGYSSGIKINLPQFPDDLKQAADLSYITQLKPTQVSFIQDKALGGYSSFYQNDLSKSGSTKPLSKVDRTSKVFIFNQSVGYSAKIKSSKQRSRYLKP